MNEALQSFFKPYIYNRPVKSGGCFVMFNLDELDALCERIEKFYKIGAYLQEAGRDYHILMAEAYEIPPKKAGFLRLMLKYYGHNPKFDAQLRKMFRTIDGKYISQGYNMQTGLRDICFEFKKDKLPDPKPRYVQLCNPMTKRWVKIDRKLGRILSHKRSEFPYKNVPMVKGVNKGCLTYR